MMGVLGTAVVTPSVATRTFGVLFGAEDTTNGTAYTTSDQSGYAHLDYARVDVPTTGTTIGGTVYGTAGADRNNMGIVAPSARILNLFPLSELTKISIRRGRTRPDQWDDIGEMTVEVLNPNGSSDPDNNTGRYQKLTTPVISGGTAVATYKTWIQPGMYAQVVYGSIAGTNIPLFTGILEEVVPTDDRYSVATYTFVDRMALLGRASLGDSAKVGAVGDTGAQRLKMLTDIAGTIDITNGNGSPTFIEQIVNIASGFTRLLKLPSTGDTVLDAAKTVVAGQAGRIYSLRQGIVQISDRDAMQATFNAGTAATFTDTPAIVAGIGYDEIHTNQGQNFVYNSAVVTVGSSISATAKLPSSIAQYGERRDEVDTCLRDAADALAVATFYATNWSDPVKSVYSLSTEGYAMPQADLEALFKLDLNKQVRVYRQLPGGRVLDVNCIIEGIELDITSTSQRFTFYLSPKDTTTITWPS